MPRLFLAILFLAAGCSATVEQTAPAMAGPTGPPALELQWIAEGFEAPEGVAPAPDGGYFISNVNGDGTAKDGNGYVTHLSADGTVLERYWAAKLNAPKGMTVLDGKLYVADIADVVVFDATDGRRLERIRIEGATFLNDVTSWNGVVYVSDSRGASIYAVSDVAYEVWLSDARLAGVNGLLGDGERMLVSTMTTGSLFSVSPDGVLTEIATGMENADGIGLVPDGGYLVSSWPGQIHYVGEDGAVTTLVDGEVMQNDLTVIGNAVIVPNWGQNTVTMWKVGR
mgnify:CR=1 FL=1